MESAIFDPVSIRRTAFRYALRSEASLRFEKGQESRLARIGADRTARLIAEWAGGAVAPGAVDTDPVEPSPHHVTFRPARVNRLLGTTIDADEQRALLTRVGIETRPASNASRVRVAAGTQPLEVDPAGDEAVIDATVPTWRRDLAVEADIAEEIIRVHGYDLVPSVTPHTPMPPWRPDPLALRTEIRETLVGAGLSEVVTSALVSPQMVERFGWHDDGPLDDEPDQRPAGRAIVVTNPLSSQHSVMRQSLTGSLLEVVSTNLRHGRDDVAIFEVGKGYGAPTDRPSHEWWRLGIALTGAAQTASPIGPQGRTTSPTRRASSRSCAAVCGSETLRSPRSPTIRTFTLAERPSCAPEAIWSVVSASCTRPWSSRSTCAPSASTSPSWRSRAWPAASRPIPGRGPVTLPVGRP